MIDSLPSKKMWIAIVLLVGILFDIEISFPFFCGILVLALSGIAAATSYVAFKKGKTRAYYLWAMRTPQKYSRVKLTFGFIVLLMFLVAECYAVMEYRDYRKKEATLSAAPLVLALEEYKKEHDASPERLQDLVPRYIKEIPRASKAIFSSWEYDYFKNGDRSYSLSFKPSLSGTRFQFNIQTQRWDSM
jgi:hypothetical protein